MIKHNPFKQNDSFIRLSSRVALHSVFVSAMVLMTYQSTQASPTTDNHSNHRYNRYSTITRQTQPLPVVKLPKPDFNQPMPTKLTSSKFAFKQIKAKSNGVPLPNITEFYQSVGLSAPKLAKSITHNQPNIIRNNGDVFYFNKAEVGNQYVISYYQTDTSHQYMPHSLLLIQNLITGKQLALNLKNMTNSEEIVNQIQRGSFTQSQWTESDALFDIDFALIEGNVLYLSYGHGTYSADTSGKTGYLSAIDISDIVDRKQEWKSKHPSVKLLWTSPALVSNARNFVIDGNYLLTGYGFTREKDYLYLIDKQTGMPVAKRWVKTAPDFIAIKANKLYVRTYDIDYIFQRK